MSENIVIERFDSITDYVDVIGKRTPNRVFSCRGLASSDNSSDFTLTKSYDESLQLLMIGYKEGLEKLTASADKRIDHVQKVPKNIPTTSVVGYVPHVPNAITGIPQSMITSSSIEQKAKVITILYDFGSNSGTDANQFVTAGRNLLAAILTLELSGYRVGLKIMTSFCGDKQRSFSVVQVKHHRQPINPLKVSYPILHPSFFRRQGFRWLETCPDVTDNRYASGYGVSLRHASGCGTVEARREYLSKNGILEAGCFFTEFIEAEKNTPDKLIELMGINKKQSN